MVDKVYFNGELIERDRARVDMEDRGYQFGDGVYEVIVLWQGTPFKLEAHMQRLVSSAEAIDMNVPSREWFIDEAYNYLEEVSCLSEEGDYKLYVQVTRGVSSRGHAYPDDIEPQILMKATEISPHPREYFEEGVRVITYPDRRWSMCHVKSLQLLPNARAKKAAEEADAYEVIFLRDGFAMEGSLSNLFIVEDGCLITPPATNYILNGITRRTVIELADKNDLAVKEESITVDRLLEADEIFMTGTTTDVMPIIKVDEQTVADGTPGEVTKKLQGAYWELARNG